jgi:hypothetical protein
MTTLATESWTGTNGAAWPAQWTTTTGCTIQSNEGAQTPSGAYADTTAYITSLSSVTNVDILVEVSMGSFTEDFMGIGTRHGTSFSSGGYIPDVGYSVELYASGSAPTLYVYKDTTQIGSGSTHDTMVVSTLYYVRFRVQGSSTTTVQTRVWKVGNTEPGTWDVSYTDTSSPHTSGYGCSLGVQTGADGLDRTYRWANLLVTDNGTASAASSPKPVPRNRARFRAALW